MIEHTRMEIKEETFDFAYVDKATCKNVQVWPAPDDLENWHQIDFDPKFKYRGKRYVPESGEWVMDADLHRKAMISERRRAYVAESDPLFMEYQFDQTTEAEQRWIGAVEAIKARYPLEMWP
jgi:hypothetical protein